MAPAVCARTLEDLQQTVHMELENQSNAWRSLVQLVSLIFWYCYKLFLGNFQVLKTDLEAKSSLLETASFDLAWRFNESVAVLECSAGRWLWNSKEVKFSS
jgi:hypothetical protein